MNNPLQEQITFDLHDRWLDLKLAFLETQLQDQYPDIQITCEMDLVHHEVKVKLAFDNVGDLCHWQLSQSPHARLIVYCA